VSKVFYNKPVHVIRIQAYTFVIVFFGHKQSNKTVLLQYYDGGKQKLQQNKEKLSNGNKVG